MKQTDYRWRCTNCGKVSPGDTKRCPVCDALLALYGEVLYNEAEPDLPVRSVEVEVIEEQEAVKEKPKKEKKEKQEKKPERKKPVFSKGLLIGLCALLAIAVLVAVLPQLLDDPSHNEQLRDPAPSASDPADSATDPRELWEDNVLRQGELGPFLEDHGISASSVYSVIFQNTFSGAPADAWDLSDKQNGSVLAWMEQNGENSVLYIAGEGGVCAHKDSRRLFDEFTGLKQISFNDSFYTEYVSDMGYMFNFCYALTELDLTSFNTSNVTNMEYMFGWCYGLTELNLSSFDTSKVTNMSGMFYNCSVLPQLNISNFITTNVETMSAMFAHCENLTELQISNFDTANVKNMLLMFSGCGKLTKLDLSRFVTTNVKRMEMMFSGCKELKELDISGFDTANVENMASMFAGCSDLQTLKLGTFDTSSVTDYEGFMDGDTLPDGRPWIELFEKNETLVLRFTDIMLTKIGETYTLEVIGNLKNEQVTWTSSNKEIVKVDANGKVTCLKWGTATITASYNGQEVKCTVRCAQK